MKSTVVKGSPYIFSEFCDNTTFFINSSSITEFFDGNGNSILAKKGTQLQQTTLVLSQWMMKILRLKTMVLIIV